MTNLGYGNPLARPATPPPPPFLDRATHKNGLGYLPGEHANAIGNPEPTRELVECEDEYGNVILKRAAHKTRGLRYKTLTEARFIVIRTRDEPWSCIVYDRKEHTTIYRGLNRSIALGLAALLENDNR